ncbi:MAG TPA: hypothetical protein VET48_03160 [Steroidobacteraceae bacterium]|nr:hypothetical protein [Steroidobacteraceae bacterium]
MSDAMYHGLALLLAAVLLWQLISGKALGTWTRPVVARANDPGIYWILLTIHCAILIIFLLTGKSWHLRQ